MVSGSSISLCLSISPLIKPEERVRVPARRLGAGLASQWVVFSSPLLWQRHVTARAHGKRESWCIFIWSCPYSPHPCTPNTQDSHLHTEWSLAGASVFTKSLAHTWVKLAECVGTHTAKSSLTIHRQKKKNEPKALLLCIQKINHFVFYY